MSPGNSYFKEEEVTYLLKTAVERFGRVAVMVADVPAISTYIAFGYPENKARREKAIPQGNLLKNRAKRAMEKLGYTDGQVKIFDWGSEVETHPDYKIAYESIYELYVHNEHFQKDADETTRAVLVGSQREIPDLEKATKTAVHYLLSEFAFMKWSPHFFGVTETIYIYHKNWPVFESWIAGTYDGVSKKDIGFLLIENPWETYTSVSGTRDSDENTFETAFERINKTKRLRVGFSHYPPAFMCDEAYDNFSGIFYEILVSVARKHEWNIFWSEETGYGVVADALNSHRIDVFGSPIWPIPERKEVALFSESLYKSPVFTYTKEEFAGNQEDIKLDSNLRVVVKENDISHSIALSEYPNARFVYIPQLANTTELLKFVVENKADITFVEPYIADHFNRESALKVIPLAEEPLRVFENVFMFSKVDEELKSIFDAEVSHLKSSGEIKKLIMKYAGNKDAFIN